MGRFLRLLVLFFTVPFHLSAQIYDSNCIKLDKKKPYKLDYSYVDEDKDKFFKNVPGKSACFSSSELQYFKSWVPDSQRDCDDSSNKIKGPALYKFKDEDRDSYYAVANKYLCSSEAALSYHSNSVPLAKQNDCNDSQPTLFKLLPYTYIDADDDGSGIYYPNKVCSNGTLPKGYILKSKTTYNDCNDQDPLAWKKTSYKFKDLDGDGLFFPENSSVCANSLPPNYANTAPKPYDTDDTFKNVPDLTVGCNSLEVLEYLNYKAAQDPAKFQSTYSLNPSATSKGVPLKCWNATAKVFEDREVSYVDFVMSYAGPAIFNEGVKLLLTSSGATVSEKNISDLSQSLYLKYFSNLAPDTQDQFSLIKKPSAESRALRQLFENFFLPMAEASGCEKSKRRGSFKSAIAAFFRSLFGIDKRSYETKTERGASRIGAAAGAVISRFCPAFGGATAGIQAVSYALYKRRKGSMSLWTYVAGYHFSVEMTPDPCACDTEGGGVDVPPEEDEYENYWNFQTLEDSCTYEFERFKGSRRIDSGTRSMTPGSSLSNGNTGFVCSPESSSSSSSEESSSSE